MPKRFDVPRLQGQVQNVPLCKMMKYAQHHYQYSQHHLPSAWSLLTILALVSVVENLHYESIYCYVDEKCNSSHPNRATLAEIK